MRCDQCTGEHFTKAGRDRQWRQLYRCKACGRRMTIRSMSAFRGYRFPDDVIALAVRHSLRYRLSYADVVEWLAERGITVDSSTVYDWVHTFTTRFIAAARAYRSPVSRRWRVDETSFKIGGRSRSLYRAIDECGQIVDVYLSDHRNAAAAQMFFEEAIKASSVSPARITTGYPLGEAKCYPPALRAVLPLAEHRSSKYLNNRLERDHQYLKGRVRSMRRFKTTGSARTFCRGHALIRNLARGHSSLAAEAAPHVRLASAWSALAASL